jgi:hypothetical protein
VVSLKKLTAIRRFLEMRRTLAIAFTCVLFLAGFAAASPEPELVAFFSFEQDFEGWATEHIKGFDPNEDWSVTRSQDRARDGSTSLRFFFQGTFDLSAGPSWIVRPFSLTPAQTYQVLVDFYLATPFSNDTINAPTIIAGASQVPPVTFQDLTPFLQDFGFNEKSFGFKYRWVKKQYEFTAQPSDSGQIYVIVGLRDFGEISTLYIDSVRIACIRRQAGAVQPVISSATRTTGRNLRIEGSAFGPSPRVLINNIDRTSFVVVSSPTLIKVKGAFFDLGLRNGDNSIRVVDDTTAAASEPFDLKEPH